MVFKFCNDGTEPDKREDILYDVGRTEWIITEIDDNMIAKIKWPLSKQSILVKKETKLNLNWPEYFIEIKRFYGKHYKSLLLSLSLYIYMSTLHLKIVY